MLMRLILTVEATAGDGVGTSPLIANRGSILSTEQAGHQPCCGFLLYWTDLHPSPNHQWEPFSQRLMAGGQKRGYSGLAVAGCLQEWLRHSSPAGWVRKKGSRGPVELTGKVGLQFFGSGHRLFSDYTLLFLKSPDGSWVLEKY